MGKTIPLPELTSNFKLHYSIASTRRRHRLVTASLTHTTLALTYSVISLLSVLNYCSIPHHHPLNLSRQELKADVTLTARLLADGMYC